MTLVRPVALALSLAAATLATLAWSEDASACGPYEPPTDAQRAEMAAWSRLREVLPKAKLESTHARVVGDEAEVELVLAGKKKPLVVLATVARARDGAWRVVRLEAPARGRGSLGTHARG